jgi:hypothetical protein
MFPLKVYKRKGLKHTLNINKVKHKMI